MVTYLLLREYIKRHCFSHETGQSKESIKVSSRRGTCFLGLDCVESGVQLLRVFVALINALGYRTLLFIRNMNLEKLLLVIDTLEISRC